jgi:hypothetical protein
MKVFERWKRSNCSDTMIIISGSINIPPSNGAGIDKEAL